MTMANSETPSAWCEPSSFCSAATRKASTLAARRISSFTRLSFLSKAHVERSLLLSIVERVFTTHVAMVLLAGSAARPRVPSFRGTYSSSRSCSRLTPLCCETARTMLWSVPIRSVSWSGIAIR